MNKVLRALPVVVVCLFVAQEVLAQGPPLAPGTHAVQVEAGVRVKMRDGVSLVCDIYRPMAAGRFPVLLTRTPYNRKDPATGMFLASHGYVVILQDTRGRFDSEGEFYPFRHEASDGYDTVEWAAALPYSDGRVGTFGGSYVGATQMLAASSAPPHLVGIFPYVTASEYYEGWTYQGGALMQWFAESWTSGLAVDTVTRKTGVAEPAPRSGQSTCPSDEYRIAALPTAAEAAPYFRDWVAARDRRRVLGRDPGVGPLRQDEHQGAARGRLARHLQRRVDPQLHRDAEAGADRSRHARASGSSWARGRTQRRRPKAGSAA